MRKRIATCTRRWNDWAALALLVPPIPIAQASAALEETAFIESIEGHLRNTSFFSIL